MTKPKRMTPSRPSTSRSEIINTVQKPLGFFVLVVLLVEAMFGAIATLSAGDDRTFLLRAMVALLFALILIVTLLAWLRPEALSGTRPAQASPATSQLLHESPSEQAAARPATRPKAAPHGAGGSGSCALHTLYSRDSEMLPYLLSWIKKHKPTTAALIQYSGQSTTHILHELLENGGSVTLWIQDPGKAIGDEQRARIDGFIKSVPGVLHVDARHELTVKHYHLPASIRGMLIDRRLLVIGWYTYEHRPSQVPPYPDDDIEISGHDRPCWVLHDGAPGFDVLRHMFERQLKEFSYHQPAEARSPVLVSSQVTSGKQ